MSKASRQPDRRSQRIAGVEARVPCQRPVVVRRKRDERHSHRWSFGTAASSSASASNVAERAGRRDAFQATFLHARPQAKRSPPSRSPPGSIACFHRLAYAKDAGRHDRRRRAPRALDRRSGKTRNNAIARRRDPQLPTSARVLCSSKARRTKRPRLLLGVERDARLVGARASSCDRLTRRGCVLSAAGLATAHGTSVRRAAAWIPPTAKAASRSSAAAFFQPMRSSYRKGVLRGVVQQTENVHGHRLDARHVRCWRGFPRRRLGTRAVHRLPTMLQRSRQCR